MHGSMLHVSWCLLPSWWCGARRLPGILKREVARFLCQFLPNPGSSSRPHAASSPAAQEAGLTDRAIGFATSACAGFLKVICEPQMPSLPGTPTYQAVPPFGASYWYQSRRGVSSNTFTGFIADSTIGLTSDIAWKSGAVEITAPMDLSGELTTLLSKRFAFQSAGTVISQVPACETTRCPPAA